MTKHASACVSLYMHVIVLHVGVSERYVLYVTSLAQSGVPLGHSPKEAEVMRDTHVENIIA